MDCPGERETGVVCPLALSVAWEAIGDVSVAETTLPSFHSMDTSMPVRVRSPLTLPDDQAAGSAGRRMISSGVDWSSISAIPALPPKLPSIWKGVCASNRFG